MRDREVRSDAHFRTPYSVDILSCTVKVGESELSQGLIDLAGCVADWISVLHQEFPVLIVLLPEPTERHGRCAQVVKLIEKRLYDLKSATGALTGKRSGDLQECIHLFLTVGQRRWPQ